MSRISEKRDDSWNIQIRLRIWRGQSLLFGSGIADLLRRTDQLGSLSAAARTMGMSYRKALRLVGQAEEQLGRELLEKTIGGVGGGGSQLTAEAREIAAAYKTLEEELERQVHQKAADLLCLLKKSL